MDHNYDMLPARGVWLAEVPRAMGCNVNVSAFHERPKPRELLSVVAMHIARMVILVLLTMLAVLQGVAFPPMLAAALAFCELFVSWWFWSLRMEAYGFAVGLSVSNVFFSVIVLAGNPSIVFLTGWILLAALSCVELLVLALIQSKGYFSYGLLALAGTGQIPSAAVDAIVFRMVVVTQGLKALFVLLGSYSVFVIFRSLGDLVALMYALGAAVFGSLDMAATAGFIRGREWGFHLVSSMAAMGIVETVLSLSWPVLFLSIWIVTLLMPCWAKNEFLSRVSQAERNMIGLPG